MSSLYWNCDSVQGAWIYLRLRAVSLAAVKKKRTAQKHKKHEVRSKEEKENKLASKKSARFSHRVSIRTGVANRCSVCRFSRLSARGLNLSSMTSCLPSYRHGYMTVGQDLRKITGQFWAFEALPGMEQPHCQFGLCWHSLFWPTEVIRSGVARRPPVKTGSSEDTLLTVCLDEELFTIKSPNHPLRGLHIRACRAFSRCTPGCHS